MLGRKRAKKAKEKSNHLETPVYKPKNPIPIPEHLTTEDMTIPKPVDIYESGFDYKAYSMLKSVNVIPEKDFKMLTREAFSTIAENLRVTYGPYGRQVMITDQNETTTTKDGFNVFCKLGFKDQYRHKIYLAIKKICDRVNRTVGDGTTSCILLAEKMFNAINQVIETPDDQRNVLKVLGIIEKDLQDPKVIDADIVDGKIKPLSMASLKALLSMAGNYDDELTEVLFKAFDPTVVNETTDEDPPVETVRNVITDTEVDPESDTNVHYSVQELPGQYRVRVDMLNLSFAYSFTSWTNMKIAVFDHLFTASDWAAFMQNYDKEKEEMVLILARAFTNGFINNEYARYCKNMGMVKRPVNIILATVKGNFVQNEIQDLAAITKAIPYTQNLFAPIDHNDFPVIKMKMFGGNCLCIDDLEPPTEYIHNLELEMKKDLSKSYIKKKDYIDRISALSLKNTGDTMLNVKGGTTLEVNLISDKIDDCTCIVNSAKVSGIVPNMLRYGYGRIARINTEEFCGDTKLPGLVSTIAKAIQDSIKGLFMDVWRSKYLGNKDVEGLKVCDEFYEEKYQSYDIVEEVFSPTTDFLTSAQYDLEVIVAAISIVKYLLTSGAFIFDTFLMANQPDTFQFNQPED